MFRTSLDAELADLTQTAVRSLNLRHMLYSQTGQSDLWKALRHKVDIPAPGAPGNGSGLASAQAREMDYAMDLIRKATRLIAAYEQLFLHGTRVEKTLVASDDIAYPMVLALERKAVPMPPEIKSKYPGFRRRGSERLILLFNESSKPRKVTFENKQLSREAIGWIYEGNKLSDPHRVTVVIPPGDLKAVYICDPEK